MIKPYTESDPCSLKVMCLLTLEEALWGLISSTCYLILLTGDAEGWPGIIWMLNWSLWLLFWFCKWNQISPIRVTICIINYPRSEMETMEMICVSSFHTWKYHMKGSFTYLYPLFQSHPFWAAMHHCWHYKYVQQDHIMTSYSLSWTVLH